MHHDEVRAAAQLAAVALDTFNAETRNASDNAVPLLEAIRHVTSEIRELGLVVGQAHLSAMLVIFLSKQMKCTPEETLAVIIESVTCETPQL